MHDVNQALHDVRELYEKVLGRPAPEVKPGTYVPFPPGADPVRLAVEEVRQLKTLSDTLSKAAPPPAWVPRADCFTTKEGFLILLEVPGVAREDLHVFAEGGELVVRGERKASSFPTDLQPLSIERAWGPFERRFALSPGPISDRITARYLHGILELRIAGLAKGPAATTRVEVA